MFSQIAEAQWLAREWKPKQSSATTEELIGLEYCMWATIEQVPLPGKNPKDGEATRWSTA
jgi:hypothetical protein